MANAGNNNGFNMNAVAKAFVKHFYSKFDTDRVNLQSLYTNDSMLCYENESIKGKNNIMNHICKNLKFKKIQHSPSTLNVQPSGANGLLVLVTGKLKVDDSPNAIQFCETFHLKPTDKSLKNWWIQNDMFRLNYC
mmetsp:Transcript_15509/g.18986  ORF Transcript_15509/g.18986 Transcript_15509/m.18986 type:complete len:135 (-) Transcript_15509:151-555(-)